MLYCILYIVVDQLTANGIDGSVVYHLTVETEGAAISEFKTLILFSSFGLLAALTASFFLGRIVSDGFGARSSRVLSLAPMIAAFLLNPASADLYSIYQSQMSTGSDEVPVGYAEVSALSSVNQKKNLIYIYLESLEYTYFDEKVFPGLLPNLKKLERLGYSFKNIHQLYNTGWTIAGMVASQCGVPLAVAWADRNSSNRTDAFLPEATCLGDLLSAEGYSLSYMGGASLEFAGKGQFYRDHGFSDIRGRDELAHEAPENYQSKWGLYDDTLFSLLRRKLLEMGDLESPWALFSLTLDTHHPYGHTSQSCEDVKYRGGDNDILNAVHCADKLVGDLVDWMRSQALLQNTTLVLASDHLAMKNTAWDILETLPRRNFALIIDEDLGVGSTEKLASTLDIGPTVLEVLGFSNPELGFGRSLLGDNKLLPDVEQFESDMNIYLADNLPFVRSLWAYPQLDQGIRLDKQRMALILGEREITLPVLMTLSPQWRVENLILRADVGAAESAASTANKQLYIGLCNQPSQALALDSFCLSLFDGESGLPFERQLNDGELITLADLQVGAAQVIAQQTGHTSRSIKSDLFAGVSAVVGPMSEPGGHGILVDGRYVSQPRREQVAFYGYDGAGQLRFLAEDNICNPSEDSAKLVDIAQRQDHIFRGYIVLKGSGGPCDDADFKRNLSAVFSGSRLNRWYEIEPQKGYLAAIELGGNSLEFLASGERRLAIEFQSYK